MKPLPGRSPSTRIMALVCGALLAFTSAANVAIAGELTDAPVTTSLEAVRPLLVRTCLGCHDNATAAGGFSVEGMTDGADRRDRDRLIRAHDRVKAGEMPPEQDELPDRSRQDLVAALADCLDVADRADIRANGRVPLRRLNRHELEQSLRTLLELPDLDVADLLPEDSLRDGFPKSAEGLELSRLQFTGTL